MKQNMGTKTDEVKLRAESRKVENFPTSSPVSFLSKF